MRSGVKMLRNILTPGNWRDSTQEISRKDENVLNLQKRLKEETVFREMVEELYSAENEQHFSEILCEKIILLGYDVVMCGRIEEENSINIVIRTQKLKLPEKMRIRTGKGKILDFWSEGKSFVSDDIVVPDIEVTSVALSQVWVEEIEKLPGSAIGIPLVICDQVWGGFMVTGEGLAQHDYTILAKTGKVAGSALKMMKDRLIRAQKIEEFTSSLKKFHLLQEINNALNSTMDLGHILQILVRGLHDVFGYETPSVYLLDEERRALLVKEYYIESTLAEKVSRLVGFGLKNYSIPLFEGSRLKRALDTKNPLVTGDIPGLLPDFTNNESLRKLAYPLFRLGTVSWLAALPLIAADEPVGMLVVTRENEIKPEDVKDLGGFLQQASLAIKRAELHQQLEESLERVREANQMKSQFIDIASHELRTPLTPMRLYLEMIGKGEYGEISEELKKKVLLLQESTKRLQEIIDKTLTSSQIIKGEFSLKKTDVSLKEVVSDVVLQLKFAWEERNQKIRVGGTVPMVRGDREALTKVVHILVDNAIKYSGENSTITVKMYDEQEAIRIAVSDEGIGIPPEYKEKIFDEFFIVPSEKEYARIDGRTGLGLFIAKGIVEEHGGRIWVESSRKGSTFYFTVPKS